MLFEDLTVTNWYAIEKIITQSLGLWLSILRCKWACNCLLMRSRVSFRSLIQTTVASQPPSSHHWNQPTEITQSILKRVLRASVVFKGSLNSWCHFRTQPQTFEKRRGGLNCAPMPTIQWSHLVTLLHQLLDTRYRKHLAIAHVSLPPPYGTHSTTPFDH